MLIPKTVFTNYDSKCICTVHNFIFLKFVFSQTKHFILYKQNMIIHTKVHFLEHEYF